MNNLTITREDLESVRDALELNNLITKAELPASIGPEELIRINDQALAKIDAILKGNE